MEDKKEQSGIELDAIDLSALLAAKKEAPEVSGDSEVEEVEIGEESLASADEPAPPRKGKGILLLAVAAVCVLCGGLFWLYQSTVRSPQSREDLPGPVRAEVGRIEKISAQLLFRLEEIETLSKVINSKAKIEQVMENVEVVEALIPRYRTARAAYVEVVKNNEDALRRSGHVDLIEIARFFQGEASRNHLIALQGYIDVTRKYLTYYHKKFESVKNREQPQLQSYEALYLDYKRAHSEYDHARGLSNQAIETLTGQYPNIAALVVYDKKGTVFTWID